MCIALSAAIQNEANNQSPLFVSDECVSELVTVTPPVSADVGGDCVGAVQSNAAVGEVTQTTEHGLEVRDLFLQRETVREMMREGRGGEGRGAEGGGGKRRWKGMEEGWRRWQMGEGIL